MNRDELVELFSDDPELIAVADEVTNIRKRARTDAKLKNEVLERVAALRNDSLPRSSEEAKREMAVSRYMALILTLVRQQRRQETRPR